MMISHGRFGSGRGVTLRQLLIRTRYESPEHPGCCLHMLPADLIDHMPGRNMTFFWGSKTCLMSPSVVAEATILAPELKEIWKNGPVDRTVSVILKSTTKTFRSSSERRGLTGE